MNSGFINFYFFLINSCEKNFIFFYKDQSLNLRG